MQRLTKTVILTAGVLDVVASLAATADGPRERTEEHPPAAAKIAMFRQYVHLQRQVVETVEDPVLAAAIGVNRIKEIAVKTKKLDEGVEALRHVAEETEHPIVKRLALLALSELHLTAGNAAEAIESLAAVCLAAEDEDEEEDEEGLTRQSRRRVRPRMAGRPGPGPCRPGMCGPCPRRGGERERMERLEREQLERREREEREEMERRQRQEREEMERLRLHRQDEGRRRHLERMPRRRRELEGMGRREDDPHPRPERGRDPLEMLERRSRELDERARQVERRMEELKRWAEELEVRERRGRPPADRDERRP